MAAGPWPPLAPGRTPGPPGPTGPRRHPGSAPGFRRRCNPPAVRGTSGFGSGPDHVDDSCLSDAWEGEMFKTHERLFTQPRAAGNAEWRSKFRFASVKPRGATHLHEVHHTSRRWLFFVRRYVAVCVISTPSRFALNSPVPSL